MKILSFDEAFEYVQKLDAEQPTEELTTDDKIQMLSELDDENKVDIRNVIEHIQEYLNTIMDEVQSIYEKEYDILEKVDLVWKVLEETGELTQIQCNTEYKNFSFEQIIVVPTEQWLKNKDREEFLDYVKAITVREYRDIERNE